MRDGQGGEAGRRPGSDVVRAADEGGAAVEGGAAANRAERMRACLEARFAPTWIELEDESARHSGHAGARDGCGETHFALLVVSQAFDGLSRVQRSRTVHEALAAEFAGGLHALSLTLRTPAERSTEPAGDRPGRASV